MSSERAPRLSMRGIHKRFGATVALRGVELEIRAGEVHALVGENGAGKSTLMNVLAGATQPDSGEMRLDGEAYRPRSPLDARRSGVGIVHQELSLAAHLSVAENVMLGAEPRHGWLVDRRELRRRARTALTRVGRPDLSLDRRVAEIGLADRQLVEIARALALDAKLIVLDEPTSSLGREDVAKLFALVRKLREQGTSTVYISHVLEEVFELADRVTVLRDGCTMTTDEVRAMTPKDIIGAMVGREVSELYPRTEMPPGEVIASVRGLSGLSLPSDATLDIRRGQVLGIAGLIGSGRTEFLRALFGLERVTGGTLRVLGVEGPRAPHERWKDGVGFASEDRKSEGLALSRSIAENLCLPKLATIATGPWLAPSTLHASAAQWIDRLGIKCAGPGQRASALSGGNQQKIALARLLFAEVDLLLLDEPTRGVDVGAKAEIYRLIDELARVREPRKAVVVVSSYLPELLGICDHIAVMARGILHAPRPVDEIDEHDVMLQAAGGAL